MWQGQVQKQKLLINYNLHFVTSSIVTKCLMGNYKADQDTLLNVSLRMIRPVNPLSQNNANKLW